MKPKEHNFRIKIIHEHLGGDCLKTNLNFTRSTMITKCGIVLYYVLVFKRFEIL